MLNKTKEATLTSLIPITSSIAILVLTAGLCLLGCGNDMPIYFHQCCSQSLASAVYGMKLLKAVIGFSGHVGIWAHHNDLQVNKAYGEDWNYGAGSGGKPL